MSLIENERTKLLATACNNAGVATIVTGLVTPAVATLYGAGTAIQSPWWPFIGIAWLTAGLGLHVIGQVILGRLKP